MAGSDAYSRPTAAHPDAGERGRLAEAAITTDLSIAWGRMTVKLRTTPPAGSRTRLRARAGSRKSRSGGRRVARSGTPQVVRPGITVAPARLYEVLFVTTGSPNRRFDCLDEWRRRSGGGGGHEDHRRRPHDDARSRVPGAMAWTPVAPAGLSRRHRVLRERYGIPWKRARTSEIPRYFGQARAP
jgi:hypothetical protein